MSLPPASDFTGASITEGQFKTAITSLRTYLATLLGTDETDQVSALTALGAILCDSLEKTGAYTVAAADKGKTINCTGSGGWTLSITAAATLGDAFAFAVWNNTSGNITLDPNASEQIDGASTKVLAAGKLAIVYCDGAKFVTVGSIATGSGSGLDADLLDGQHGSYYATASGLSGKVGTDNGYNAVGSYAIGAGASGWTAGSTYSAAAGPGYGSGTWRCVGVGTHEGFSGSTGAFTASHGLFQRIS